MGLDWEGYKLKNPHFKFYKMTSPGKESTWMNTSTQAPIGLGNMNSFNKFTGILERKDFANIKIYGNYIFIYTYFKNNKNEKR
ncbi:hypothetical protein PG637_09730 [Riemerella anatipestifer]|nr:hypothetical protein [Riemerella anatipestifer]MDY3325945.1 hypothetical protein [Riemerella anatipestifer]MDY3352506.1 hypothetical protein [Riemerella anatipestifer]